MGCNAQGGRLAAVVDVPKEQTAHGYTWGPLSGLGLAIGLLACLVDQAAKFWLLYGLDLPSRSHIALTSFIEVLLTWNTGISYGLFPQQGPLGQWALLAFKVGAVAFLWVWLTRATSRLTAVALGLIIGGAVGNAIDRLHWPGVLDFVLFHIETVTWSFRWYVFNLADVAIVAGVFGLLYESLRNGNAAKAP
jgi:signal peptidase II